MDAVVGSQISLCNEFCPNMLYSSSSNITNINILILIFTVECLVAWGLNEGLAGVDVALIDNSLHFSCVNSL